MSDLNLGFLKKHKIAVGVVAVTGGIVIFYLLSQQGGSGATAAPSGDGGIAAADATLGQAQAAAAIQTNAQQVALQTAQLNAQVTNQQTSAAQDVTDTQTIASLIAALNTNSTGLAVTQSNNNSATLQNMNQLTSEQNIYQIQEGELEDQINQAANENANDNATSLSALVDQLNAQGEIATTTINDAYNLSAQQQLYNQQNTALLIPTFGKTYNSALDANNAAAETLTVLSGGNPAVAGVGVESSASATASGNAASASIINNITSSVSKLAGNIGSGLFA